MIEPYARNIVESWNPGETLKLSFLGLTKIPSDLPDSVKSLSLTCNHLTTLDNLPSMLQILYVGGNHLYNIPDTLPSTLQTLFINDNQLRSLPNTLPDSLEKIMAYSNELESLPDKLPSNLKMLAVNHNRLKRLPTHLPDSLTFLNVTYNPLYALPDRLPTNIVHCIARHTQISYLPTYLPPNLSFLGVDMTRLPNRLSGESIHKYHYRIEFEESKKRTIDRLKSIKEELIAATWETSRVEPWCGELWDVKCEDF